MWRKSLSTLQSEICLIQLDRNSCQSKHTFLFSDRVIRLRERVVATADVKLTLLERFCFSMCSSEVQCCEQNLRPVKAFFFCVC